MSAVYFNNAYSLHDATVKSTACVNFINLKDIKNRTLQTHYFSENMGYLKKRSFINKPLSFTRNPNLKIYRLL